MYSDQLSREETGTFELTNEQLSASVASHLSCLESRTGVAEATGSNLVEVLNLSGFFAQVLKLRS